MQILIERALRRSGLRVVLCWMTASLAVTLLAACGSPPKAGETVGADSSKPAFGGTFTTASTVDGTFLNPILNQDAFSSSVNRLIFDSLLRLDGAGESIPWLAIAPPAIEEGGKKWTFKLRAGVKWQDGHAFSASDVKFTFDAIMHPTYTGIHASDISVIKGGAALRADYDIIGKDVQNGRLTKDQGDRKKVDRWEEWKRGSAIHTPDAQTVVFLFDQVFAPALTHIGNQEILPEHLLKDELGVRMKDSSFNRKPVGTGRFAFAEWKTNERIVLDANKDWWGGRPYIDRVVIRIFPDGNTAMNALEKGEIDAAEIDPEKVDHFKNDVRNVSVFEYPSTRYSNIAYDLKNPLFEDRAVRVALSHAVDKESLVRQLLGGHGATAWSHSFPDSWEYNPDVPRHTYDPAQTRKLLDSAGWKIGTDGVRSKDGRRFSFDFYYVPSDKVDTDTAQVVQAAWKEVGIEANLKGVDQPTLLDMGDAGNPNRKQPPVYLLGWFLNASEPDSYSIWTCKGTFNDIRYCNPKVDDLEASGRSVLDRKERAKIYGQLQRQLAEDQPYLWLFFRNGLTGLAKKVKGPIAGSTVGMYWNLEKWWIDPASR